MEAWRRVEVAACEEMDGPTAADLEAIRGATFTVEAVKERERVTDHDVAAFVDVLQASAGPGGRWIHFGLTSSDVLDTALALQLQAAGEIVVAGAREVVAALAARAREHVDTVCVGRTHGVHAEPTTFGLKLAGFAFEAHRNAERLRARLRAGERRRDQRRGRHLLGDAPGVRGARAGAAGARARGGVDAGRRRATATPSCCRPSRWRAPGSSAWPPRCATCSAPRCARPRSPSAPARRARARCPTSATRSPPSGSPAWRACCAATRSAAVENVALWHERDISHSGAERVDPARLDDPARLHAAPGDARRRRAGRARRPHAREPRPDPRRAVLPAGAARARRTAGCSATTPTGSCRRTPSAPGTPARRCASCSRARELGLDLDEVFDLAHYTRHARRDRRPPRRRRSRRTPR